MDRKNAAGKIRSMYTLCIATLESICRNYPLNLKQCWPPAGGGGRCGGADLSTSFLTRASCHFLRRSAPDQGAGDLLVLCPSTCSQSSIWAKAALCTVKQLEDDSGLTVKINFLLEPLSRFRHMFFIQPPRGVRK